MKPPPPIPVDCGSTRPSTASTAVAASIPSLTLIETGLPLDWLVETPAEVADAGREIARLAAATRADLVHLNSPALAADAPFDLPLVVAAHSCVASWWEAAATGPLPADTVFVPEHAAGYDAIVAMYHDQGLPVLKAASFGRGVNVTLGLPFVRTSVDHGTALDLAVDSQRAATVDPGSLYAAVDLALELAHHARR